MKHLVVSLYTAAKFTALLPLARNPASEYLDLKIPQSWDTSVCRICVSQYSAHVGSTIAVYREFVADVFADHKNIHCRQIKEGKATIGAAIAFNGGPEIEIIWRGDRANLELGTCIAEITLDRPKSRIDRTRILDAAERYFVTGSGRIRDFVESEIAELRSATIAARKAASGERLCEEIRTVAAVAKPEPAPPHPTVVKEIQDLRGEKRRAVTAALLNIPGDTQEDGTINVSPLDWQDHKEAETFNVDSRLIRRLREELAIRIVPHDVALNDAANALQVILDDRAASERDVRCAARTLLRLVKL